MLIYLTLLAALQPTFVRSIVWTNIALAIQFIGCGLLMCPMFLHQVRAHYFASKPAPAGKTALSASASTSATAGTAGTGTSTSTGQHSQHHGHTVISSPLQPSSLLPFVCTSATAGTGTGTRHWSTQASTTATLSSRLHCSHQVHSPSLQMFPDTTGRVKLIWTLCG